MFKLADRVKEASITTGIGSVVFNETYNGFTSFSSAIGDGNSTFYTIENNANFEIGIGTYNASTNSLSRDTVLKSTNNNSKIALDGLSIVFCTYPADRAVFLDHNNYISAINAAGILFPDNSIQVTAAGGARLNKSYININSNTVISSIYDIVFVDCSSGPINLTLPNPSGNGGVEIAIKKLGSHQLSLSSAGNQLIDGKESFLLYYEHESVSLISNNTNWYVF
jgi:hypothetical protein